MRSLEKTSFLAFPEAKKGVVNCARLRKAAICAILREKTSFLAFPEAKKGVVNCARLRKAAHWPNNNANPSGLSEKKVYCVESLRFCR